MIGLRRARRLALGAAAGLVLATIGCRPGREAQLELGRATYQKRCAACHEGRERTAPELGAGLLSGYGTAARLFDYVSAMMPQDAPGRLSREEYWATVAFLLQSRGLLEEEKTLDAAAADRVRLGRGTQSR